MKSNEQLVKNVLKYTFGLVPIVAGLDKFANILTDWSQYLPASLVEIIPFDTVTFMMVVGVIEIVAGILVFYKTRLGALVVMAWLVSISLLLIIDGHLDIAVRDLVMAISAFSLAKLSENNNYAIDS